MTIISKLLRFFLWLILLALAGGTMLGTAVFLYLSPNLPSVDVLRDVQLQTPLRVFTRDGELIGEFGEMRRTPLKFEEIPPLFVKALLAAEDDSFFRHHGVDFKSLTRAATQLAVSGHIQTGGSTITMQVAKNYFLSYERTFARKFNEILLAIQIERELGKNEILELYLNKIFLGNRAYGVEAAAQVYFGKSLKELTLAQWAMIASLPKAPSSLNPIANPERALARRNWILGRMRGLDYINQTEFEQAVQEPVGASFHGLMQSVEAGYVSEMVRQEMLQRFGSKAYTEGYVAFSTLDSKQQQAARRAVADGLLAYSQRHGYRGPESRLTPAAESEWQKALRRLHDLGGLRAAAVTRVDDKSFSALLGDGRHITVEWDDGLATARKYLDVDARGPSPQHAGDVVAIGDVVRVRENAKQQWELFQLPAAQSALVSLDADSGAVLALVGGFDFLHSKFNRVTQAQRQPGSSFKPFFYTAALEHGFTPATIINDAPIVFEDAGLENTWRPENDEGKFYGPTPLRRALYKSRNVVSIRVLQQLGIERAINYVQRFGFTKAQLPRNFSLALGTLSATPMQMATAYSVLANGGFRVQPYVLDKVLDRDGNTIYQAQPALACSECTAPDPGGDELSTPTESSITLASTSNAAATASAANVAPRVVDARIQFLINSLLQDVVRRGTATAASTLGRNDIGGKTGTTNGPTDAWFSGYSGGVVTTAWLGFDQNLPIGKKEFGSTAALPIWMDYMRVALKDRPERIFRQPEGVVSLRIDPHTGLRAQPGQPDAVFEYFLAENQPTQESTYVPGAAGESGGAPATEDIF
ncbi:MAG: penicillin-binding protein 1A [Spongiibacteraceae bacterium]